jgi:S-methylmethionine-dependent homocysteine/selenocysteine methylase
VGTPPLILDGAVGTELWGRGVPTEGALFSAFAVDHAPEVLGAIHRDYADAGATVHTAATFRTKRRSAGPDWERLARAAVSIARAAVRRDHRVAGSIAPLEDCYRPDLAPADAMVLAREHGELARVLADSGVDLLIAEAMAAPHEAEAAAAACVATGIETWVALTAGPRGDLLTPAALAEAARRCVDRGASTVLVNCVPATKTLAYVEALARIGARVGAYANAGEKDDGLGWLPAERAGAAAARYASLARTWMAAGATVLGGCCGTGPAHIRALVRSFTGAPDRLDTGRC